MKRSTVIALVDALLYLFIVGSLLFLAYALHVAGCLNGTRCIG